MAANRKIEIILVTFAMAATWWAGQVTAQSSSCTNVLISLSPCLNYITGNSSTPSSQCCTQLSSVVRSQPQCLCQVLNGGASSLGINVNQTQALALPTACNVQTPPVNRCSASSPADSPSGTPDSPSSGGDGGSKTVPSTDNGTSDGNSTKKLTFSLIFFMLFVASYASAF